MSVLSDLESTTSERSRQVRLRLNERCLSCLRNLGPLNMQGQSRGIWSEDDILSLTAIFELQCVELQSEMAVQMLDNKLIANLVHRLTTTDYFTDAFDASALLHIACHLRLIASALRVYKFHGRSLEGQLHIEIYDGLTRLWDVLDNAQRNRDQSQLIEKWDVKFLLQHCQGLLVSVDSSDSFTKKASKRATLAFDTAVSGASGQYQELRPGLLKVLKRQRNRPSWHAEYVRLEDACTVVFAGDMRIHRANEIQPLADEAVTAALLLQDSIEYHYQGYRPENKIESTLRHAFGHGMHMVSNAGPYQENPEYLRYGILDLLSNLAICIRKRARPVCFNILIDIIQTILQRAPKSATQLQLKATDLWNRILDISKKEGVTHGNIEARKFISRWIRDNPEISETDEASKRSCNL